MKQCYVTLLKAIKLAGSQKELALILGVDQANLNKWVHYKRSMPTKYGHIIKDWSDGIITKQALFPENKDLQPTIDNVKTKDKIDKILETALVNNIPLNVYISVDDTTYEKLEH